MAKGFNSEMFLNIVEKDLMVRVYKCLPTRIQKYGGRVDVTEEVNATIQAAEDEKLAVQAQEANTKRINQKRELLREYQLASQLRSLSADPQLKLSIHVHKGL
jgi:hypothetical protein